MVSEYLFTFFKYFLWFALAYVIYVIYEILLKPYLFWRKYKKYQNVYVEPNFIPFFGDLWFSINDIKQNKVQYFHKIKNAQKLSKYDLKVKLEGSVSKIELISQEAIKEFISYQPKKIDRHNSKRGLGKASPHSFVNQRTTKYAVRRRNLFTNLLSLNKASKYIPGMIKCAQDTLNKMKDGETTDFLAHNNEVTFDIMTNILYGDDVHKLANKYYDFENKDGKMEKIPLREFLFRSVHAYAVQYFNPLGNIFPLMDKYNLAGAFKRDLKNFQLFKDKIMEIVNTTKDEKSVCRTVMEAEDYEYIDKLDDILTFMAGGSETSSRLFTAILYYLKKFPHTLRRLLEEIKENGFDKHSKEITLEKLQQMDYLNNVLKETLRIDHPVPESFTYECYEPVEICGVPLPKGTLLRQDIITCQHSEDIWLNPEDFEPDRFDINSQFYQKALKLGKNCNAYSRRSFGLGNRNCPGQTLTFLEIKVLAIFFLSRIDYEVSEELLKKDGVGFGMGSQFRANFTVHFK